MFFHMNTTITVALITALSTLSGAAATGYLGLLINRAQLRTQQNTGEIDRNEQHEKYLRESRRDAYLAFMGQLRKIEELFDKDLWVRTGFGKEDAISPGEIMYTATVSLVELESHLDLIHLEGPEEVSEIAHDLFSGLHKEIVTMMKLKNEGTKGEILANVEMYGVWHKSSQDRKKEKIKFIRAARVALEQKLS